MRGMSRRKKPLVLEPTVVIIEPDEATIRRYVEKEVERLLAVRKGKPIAPIETSTINHESTKRLILMLFQRGESDRRIAVELNSRGIRDESGKRFDSYSVWLVRNKIRSHARFRFTPPSPDHPKL